MLIEAANIHDMCLVGETLLQVEDLPVQRPDPKKEPQGLCMDKGYDYPIIEEVAETFGYEPHIRSRGEEVQAKRTGSRQRARRWVVERTHSWMNRFRYLLIRWNKKEENFVGLIHLAFAIIVANHNELFG